MTGQHVKLIERGELQPSEKSSRLFRKLKAAPVLGGEHVSTEALAHVSEIWNHILAVPFKCPACARDVRKVQRHKGLEFWWGASPSQKYCPDHQAHAKRKGPSTK